jgi:hypothetical protein
VIRGSFLLFSALLLACQSKPKGTTLGAAGAEPNGANFCDLPGSVRFGIAGRTVAGGSSAGKLDFVRLPAGYCAHYFGNVANARQLRFAPGGELFVASPTKGTTGGGPNGRSAIVILPDDDRDGEADSTLTFVSGVAATQGMLFAEPYFYYQDLTKILRMPYASGDRVPSAAAELVTEFSGYQSDLHWQDARSRRRRHHLRQQWRRSGRAMRSLAPVSRRHSDARGQGGVSRLSQSHLRALPARTQLVLRRGACHGLQRGRGRSRKARADSSG